MAWVWAQSRSAPTQRLVLLAIADCANDRGAEAYPSTATLAAKTGLSERGIRKAVTELAALGELSVIYKGGPQGCNRYSVLMSDPAPHATNLEQSAGFDPAPHATNPARGARNPAPRATDPARGAPKPLENHPPTEPSVEPLARKRATDLGTRLPDDFAATADMIAWAKQQTPLVGAKDTAAFVDYWRSQPGAKGRKTDWLATWRNWMRRAQTDAEARQQRANGRASPALVEVNGLRLKPETAERMTGRTRFEAMDQRQIEGPT